MSQVPFSDMVKRIGEYFEGRSLKQQERIGREAKTESSYYSPSKKRPAKLLGQKERKLLARNRAEYGQLKQLIGETQRSDLGVKLNDTLTKYYESVVQDYTTKKTEAQQRKEMTELNLPYEMRSQETKTKYGNTPSKYIDFGLQLGWYIPIPRYPDPDGFINNTNRNPDGVYGYSQEDSTPGAEMGEYVYGYFIPENQTLPTDINTFTSKSKPTWANWQDPKDELKRQQEFLDSYNKSIEKYTGFLNEEKVTAQTKYKKDLDLAEEQRQKTLGMLQTRLNKIDIAKKVNVTEETTTKIKPSLPADRVRRTSTLTPKVDQPFMFEDRPL